MAESLLAKECDSWLELRLLVLQCSDVVDERFLPRRTCAEEPDALGVEVVTVSDFRSSILTSIKHLTSTQSRNFASFNYNLHNQ